MVENADVIVEIKDLKKHFEIRGKGMLHAVDGVNLSIYAGETLGLVGESGCGKSTVGNLVMRLLKPSSGEVLFHGENIYTADKEKSMDLCRKMQIVFQDPYSSLNPRQTIRTILSQGYLIHKIAKGDELNQRLLKLCEETGISPDLLDCYPHELDGGNRQIVGIARALSLEPEFIVCDEPVSSLDVSVQAKIINKLMELQKSRKISYLFVSHDLSVVKHISHRIAVMYLGQIVELGPSDRIFENPIHPYTIALMSAVPRVDVDAKRERIVLQGDVPSPINPKEGCRFAPRCWMCEKECAGCNQELVEVEPGHFVACQRARMRMGSAEQ